MKGLAMIKIDNETKTFIKENADLLTPVSIFNLVKNEIDFLIQNGVKVSNVHKILEKELGININIKSLYSYLKRNKGLRANKRPSVKQTAGSAATDSTEKATGADVFISKLTGGVKIKKGI